VRYTELTIENFRVFHGVQTVKLPEGTGVVIVYGTNGKGKTSLLNAVRWVWTGTALRRGNRVVPDERLPNREAREAAGGEMPPCRVRLQFEADGARWDLTRALLRRDGGLVHDVTLLRDGDALTTAETIRTLAELMPKEIEQFFLFDGELLDQYEKLVDDDSAVGSMLRDSIERILGVPVVVNAERDMRALTEEAGKAIVAAARKGERTQELATYLEQAQQLQAAHRQNREGEDARAREFEAELREVEEEIAEQSNKIELLALRNDRRRQLSELLAQREEARSAFGEALAASWRGVLVEPVAAAVAKLEADLDADRERLTEATVAVALAERYRGNGERACPACDADLDDDHRDHLMQLIGGEAGAADLELLREQVETGATRIRTLRNMIDERTRADVRASEEAYRRVDVLVGDAEDELRQMEEQLQDAPEEELADLVTRQKNLHLRLEKAKQTYSEEDRNYLEMSNRVDRLRAEIARIGGGDPDPMTARREELTRDLANLFDQAKVAYRDTLRENVQEAATKIFRNMRAESDFRKLVINDQYGLRILDSNGEVVEDRSAGYEHLVALSLLGALQECSPISGPIVMDSPFFRLDPDHVRGVIGQLNVLSDQVILLVHRGELDPATARDRLRGRLLAEYELRRISAYNTEIKEVRS
jgi:DNA sulfur modification protein DndD